jgi:Ribosomal protein L11 methyltransferase (PrmA)
MPARRAHRCLPLGDPAGGQERKHRARCPAGTGILAPFAAEAGARPVWAVELDPWLVAMLCRIAELNGPEQVVEVIQADATQLDLSEPVDVVVADLIDAELLDELIVPGRELAAPRLPSCGYSALSEIGSVRYRSSAPTDSGSVLPT